MSRTTSLELSKKLYEVSGWEGESHPDHGFEDDDGNRIPYYTLGYLIRKLPKQISPKNRIRDLHIRPNYRGYDWCMYYGDFTFDFVTGADTPEDALCKLAISLFESNILQKETGDE